MRAQVGDRIVIKGHHVGEPDRDCEVLEVRGPEGAPPYVVRWDDDGHEGLFFPGRTHWPSTSRRILRRKGGPMRTSDVVVRSGVGLEADPHDPGRRDPHGERRCRLPCDPGPWTSGRDRHRFATSSAGAWPGTYRRDARVDAVMSTPVLTVQADADLDEAFTLMRHNTVRRLAVVRGGEFVGTVAIDDLMVHVANDLASLVRPVAAEMLWAHRDSSTPATT